MKKRFLWGNCGVFLAFIALFFLLNLLLPDRDFSEQENRSLQTAPVFSAEKLFSGKFMSEYESYCSDQFVLRDQWISMKARLELILGKAENNGVFLCSNEQLLEPFAAPSLADMDSRIYSINALAENTSVPVYVGLIPSSAEIYRDLLPVGVRNDSQIEAIDYVYSNVKAEGIRFSETLSEHSGEYIYYRTDHHWTSLGAYYGFTALAEAMDISFPALETFTERKTVSDSFYGTSYSTSGFAWVEPDSMETFVDQPEQVSLTRYEGLDGVPVPLYDSTRLQVKDKYSYYLGGNTPRLVIDTGDSDKPSLLIVRDSYCDSLVPFLLDSFSEIHLLDLRYYRNSVSSYVSENEIDQVLVLYSVNNFFTDRNIVLLSR